MSTRSAVIQVEPDLAEAFNTAPKTRQKKALSAMRQALRTEKERLAEVPRLSKKETELFLRINHALPPKKQERYNELRQKREDETLTESEHAELLKFVDELMTVWTDRLQAVVDLAKLRRVSPRELMKQLGIDPRAYGD
jgi:hypothetical protein